MGPRNVIAQGIRHDQDYFAHSGYTGPLNLDLWFRQEIASNQGSPGLEGEHGSVLQVIDGRHDNCRPLLNGFKGLHTEVPETRDFFEIEMIDAALTGDKNYFAQSIAYSEPFVTVRLV